MNDYKMMNQRVDQLREQLTIYNHKKKIIDTLIKDVMDELLDTRRQITQEDLRRNLRLEGESSPAPCDIDLLL